MANNVASITLGITVTVRLPYFALSHSAGMERLIFAKWYGGPAQNNWYVWYGDG
ncbi:MAG: hypothetical protein GY774_29970 [Planctomycetes bacterium]|nr:hypothetical protein [Planctomycetota bacterium]